MREFVRANARDILDVGLNPKNTFLFNGFDFMGGASYENTVIVLACINLDASKAVFGFNDRYVCSTSHSGL